MSDISSKHGGARPHSGRRVGSGKFGEPTIPVRVPLSKKQDVIDFLSGQPRVSVAALGNEERLGIIKPIDTPNVSTIPLFGYSVQAGFPSPAENYVESELNLHEHLIPHKETTFFLRAKGDSMIGAGIHDGDLLIVDKSLTPCHNNIVIAVVDGSFTVKRLYLRVGKTRLIAENPNFPPIDFGDGQVLEIWGVVTNVIHRLS